jgi:hypothetical protein
MDGAIAAMPTAAGLPIASSVVWDVILDPVLSGVSGRILKADGPTETLVIVRNSWSAPGRGVFDSKASKPQARLSPLLGS